MKKRSAFFLPGLLGLIGAALRFLQCRTVFEPDTLLAMPHILSILLPVYLLFCAALFWVTIGKKETKLDFEQAFLVPSARLLPLFVCSAMLLIAAGGYTIFVNLGAGILPMALGGAAAVAGICLFLALQRWINEEITGVLFLIPVFFALVWLLVTYQSYASWPVMTAYYVQVLAIAAVACAFYQIAACAYSQGSRRMLRFILPTAIVLAFTALGDNTALPEKGLYLAALISLYSFQICAK